MYVLDGFCLNFAWILNWSTTTYYYMTSDFSFFFIYSHILRKFNPKQLIFLSTLHIHFCHHDDAMKIPVRIHRPNLKSAQNVSVEAAPSVASNILDKQSRRPPKSLSVTLLDVENFLRCQSAASRQTAQPALTHLCETGPKPATPVATVRVFPPLGALCCVFY